MRRLLRLLRRVGGRFRKLLNLKQAMARYLSSWWLTEKGLRRLESVSRSRLCTGLYYCARGSYYQEQSAVLTGQIAFQRSWSSGDSSSLYALRRSIHRLEKGLMMRPCREVFALDYIEETVASYEQALMGSDRILIEPGPGTVSWAHDVLTSYFGIVSANEKIDRVRERFLALPAPTTKQSGPYIPFTPDFSLPAPVSYVDLMRLARRRKSVRFFLPKSVPRDVIDKAIDAAALAPSACNRQPIRFHVCDDPPAVRRIMSLPIGTSGFGDCVPVVVAVVGDLRAFKLERDRHLYLH